MSGSLVTMSGGAAGVAQRIGRGQAALAAFQQAGIVRTVPAYAEGDDRAGMSAPMPYYGDPKRGVIPAWRNEMAELSWLYWLTFDGLTGAGDVATPALFVHSDGCVLPANERAVAAEMASAELVWGEGSQIGFYDQPAQVDFAVTAAVRHFRAHLPDGPW
jgi:hypothetical protein